MGEPGFSGRHGERGDFGLQGEIGLDGLPGKWKINENYLKFISTILRFLIMKWIPNCFYHNQKGLKGQLGDKGLRGLRGPAR